MPEQCAVIREIIKEKNKVTWPILTTEEKELIENIYYVPYYLKKKY